MLALPKLFGEYSWVYNELYPAVYQYAADFARYDALLQGRGARSVLDLGCGTGLLAKYLAGAGYNYTGTDISAEMLRIAHCNVPKGRFLQCDMRDLAPLRDQRGGGFDAVLCTGRALGFMVSNADVISCLTSAGEQLRPGGIFACDVIDAGPLATTFLERNEAKTSAGGREYHRVFRNTRVPGEGWSYRVHTHFEVLERGRVVAEFDDNVTLRAYAPEELRLFMQMSGLTAGFEYTSFPHLPAVILATASKAIN